MKKNLTKLALGSLNLISLVFSGKSLEACVEGENLKSEFHEALIELDSVLKTLLLTNEDYELRGKVIRISDKAMSIINTHPIANASWRKFMGVVGRTHKFQKLPPQNNEPNYLRGYNEQQITK